MASDIIRGQRAGFTLVELLLVIAVILILMAMLLPVAGMIRNQSHRAATAKLIAELANAFDSYREADPHHYYPTPNPAHFDAAVGAYYLDYNVGDPMSTLVAMERQTVINKPGGGQIFGGYEVAHELLDQDTTASTFQCLVDPWGRPIYYWLDGGYFKPGHVRDDTLMNGAPDRPNGYGAAVTAASGTIDWNAKGIEPFAYLWSAGQLHNVSTDMLPANYANWIYVKSTP